MSTVFVRPLRGHQSKTLRRWVTADEPPYECPDGEARRLVRHGIAEIAGVEADFTAAEEQIMAALKDGGLDAYGREVESGDDQGTVMAAEEEIAAEEVES